MSHTDYKDEVLTLAKRAATDDEMEVASILYLLTSTLALTDPSLLRILAAVCFSINLQFQTVLQEAVDIHTVSNLLDDLDLGLQ